jgi:hypothetical protein
VEPLSQEDALRLNVLLANRPQAIRIDESGLVVHGLSERGEARVRLNPNCRDELYLRRVRELISGHVLGSPGGYPVYLKRWTRMGQARDESLEQLLLLGEPEAVVAVVHARGLTDELARRAWWAMPTAENARRMLEREAVVRGEMGRVLAGYLLEHLPFEQEPIDAIHSVRLVLQPGLADEPQRHALWQKARQRHAYLVGFLLATPDDLPEPAEERPDLPALRPRLLALDAAGNPFARLLLRLLGAPGQTYLRTCEEVLRRPPNQEVVSLLFDALADYFRPVGPAGDAEAELDRILADARVAVEEAGAGGSGHAAALLRVLPELREELTAMLVLSRLGYPVLRPVFSRSSAIGSLMRRKLEPITGPLLHEIGVLRRR